MARGMAQSAELGELEEPMFKRERDVVMCAYNYSMRKQRQAGPWGSQKTCLSVCLPPPSQTQHTHRGNEVYSA